MGGNIDYLPVQFTNVYLLPKHFSSAKFGDKPLENFEVLANARSILRGGALSA